MSHDTSSERKADTGPLPSLPPHTGAPARSTFPWRWVAAGLVLVAVVAVLLLVIARAPDPMQDPRPVEVVQGFIAAVEARDVDQMMTYIEPTVLRRELSPEIRAYMTYIEEIDFRDERYELLESDGQRAQVRLTATSSYRVNLGSEVKAGENDVDTTVELVNIEGAWYIRTVALPEI